MVTFGFGLQADDKNSDPVLNTKDKSVKRLESNRGFGGFTKTSVFYTFPEQAAILRVVIENQKKPFPITAILYTFKKGVSEKDLKKWLNNQTSDALYPDVPRPTEKKSLGDGVCKILKSKPGKEADGRIGKFIEYNVEFQLTKMGSVAGFQIKSFQDKASVFMKQK